MDLSKVKWLVIIAVVGGIIYYLTGPGVNSAYNNATKAAVGVNPDRDAIDEATLSKYGGYLSAMLRYEKSEEFYTTAIDRYGQDSKNFWLNTYKRARCRQKLNKYPESADDLFFLWTEDGHLHDKRVPVNNSLKNQLAKLIELFDLGEENFPGIIE